MMLALNPAKTFLQLILALSELVRSSAKLPEMEPHDFELTSQPLDYFGLNVYNRVPVTVNQQAQMDFSQGGNFLNNRTEYYPKAVYDAIHLLHDLYDIKCPIYITENGTYFEGTEPVGPEGIVEDNDRVRYVAGFLEWLEKAIDEGFDIRGYYLWSLMDNFEWSHGYSKRFGLVYVDYNNMRRIPKDSFYWYQETIRDNVNNL